jgi:hypothetical protein
MSAALPDLGAALAGAGQRASRWLQEPRAERCKTRLLAALAAGDSRAAADAAARLAGVGEGLTPAADDFLVGALYALRVLRPETAAAALAAAVADAAVPRTTTPSAQWLRRAAGGDVAPVWDRLLRDLFGGRDAEAAVGAVIATGHTSGRAALEGFVAAARALAGGAPGEAG